MDRYGRQPEKPQTREDLIKMIEATHMHLLDVEHSDSMLLITGNLLSNLVAALNSLESSEAITDASVGFDEELIVLALDTLVSATDVGIETPAEIGELLHDQLAIIEEWGISHTLVQSQFERLRGASHLLLEIHRGLYESEGELAAHAAASIKMTHSIAQAHWVAAHDQAS